MLKPPIMILFCDLMRFLTRLRTCTQLVGSGRLSGTDSTLRTRKSHEAHECSRATDLKLETTKSDSDDEFGDNRTQQVGTAER